MSVKIGVESQLNLQLTKISLEFDFSSRLLSKYSSKSDLSL